MTDISDVKEQLKKTSSYFEKHFTLIEKLFDSPIPKEEIARNLLLFADRRILSRFLFMNELYLKSLDIHGSIFEFGVRYGVNTSVLTSLRGIHEPYNHNRKIIAFDTFEGFTDIDAKNDDKSIKDGDFGVPKNYIDFLNSVLQIHESLAPLSNIKKYEFIKGDINHTLPKYLEDNPQTLISFVYLDFDLYSPTLNTLKLIENFLSPGAIIAFDEINDENWPGETVALREWLNGRSMKIFHSKYKSAAGYIEFH